MASRRRFIEIVPLAAGGLLWPPLAGAQALLDERDRQAAALGYVADASRVDRKRYPKYRAGQDCAGCQFYLAAPTQATGPCSIFPRKLVAGPGWCDAFATRR